MKREEVDQFVLTIPGMIPAERQNAGIVLAYLNGAGEKIANLTLKFSYADQQQLIEEIKAMGLSERHENAAIFFLRSVGRRFAEAREGRAKKSSHFLS